MSKECPHCEGKGICPFCKGKGECSVCEGKKHVKCPSCKNTDVCHFCGILGTKQGACPYCKGTKIWDGSEEGIKRSEEIFKITSQ